MNTELLAFVTAMGHATNILKTAIQARDDSKRREALAELNSAMADLYTRHFAVIENQQTLLGEKEALESKIAAYDKWEQEKTRYALIQFPSGGFVYALKPTHQAGDPPHWLCTNCYREREQSILQFAGVETGERGYFWACPRCKSKVMSRGVWPETTQPKV